LHSQPSHQPIAESAFNGGMQMVEYTSDAYNNKYMTFDLNTFCDAVPNSSDDYSRRSPVFEDITSGGSVELRPQTNPTRPPFPLEEQPSTYSDSASMHGQPSRQVVAKTAFNNDGTQMVECTSAAYDDGYTSLDLNTVYDAFLNPLDAFDNISMRLYDGGRDASFNFPDDGSRSIRFAGIPSCAFVECQPQTDPILPPPSFNKRRKIGGAKTFVTNSSALPHAEENPAQYKIGDVVQTQELRDNGLKAEVTESNVRSVTSKNE
jgi:hypothetical protein